MVGYNLKRIFKLKKKLYEDLLLEHSQEKISGANLTSIAETIMFNLPGVNSAETIKASLVDVYGKVFDDVIAKDISWRMAGNMHELKMGRPVPSWSVQTTDEWVPAQIVSVDVGTTVRKKKGQKTEISGAGITFRVLAGSPAGHTLAKFWSNSLCSFLAKDFGFSRWRNKPEKWPDSKPFLAYRSVRQLFGLRLNLLFTPKTCEEGKLSFDNVKITKSLQEYNRELLSKRARFKYSCPKGFTHPCHLCPVGKKECSVACHAATFVQKACRMCRKQDAWFDPVAKVGLCENCRANHKGVLSNGYDDSSTDKRINLSNQPTI